MLLIDKKKLISILILGLLLFIIGKEINTFKKEYILLEDDLSLDVSKEYNDYIILDGFTIIKGKDSGILLAESAYKELGKAYVYGDIGYKGFDCSGLIYALYLNNLGIELPRRVNDQVTIGKEVNESQLIPGDVLFFNMEEGGISHSGIYIGNGDMIHASSGKGIVTIDSIDKGYYKSKFVTGRRIAQ